MPGQDTCRNRVSTSPGNHRSPGPPVRLGHRRAARLDPGRPRRPCTCAASCDPPRAGRELVLRPARVPVGQDLHDIDHVEGPPRQRLLLTSLLGNEDGACGLARTRPGTDTHAAPHGELRDRRVGNYVIANPSNLGNFMIADTFWSTRPRPATSTPIECRIVTHERTSQPPRPTSVMRCRRSTRTRSSAALKTLC